MLRFALRRALFYDRRPLPALLASQFIDESTLASPLAEEDRVSVPVITNFVSHCLSLFLESMQAEHKIDGAKGRIPGE